MEAEDKKIFDKYCKSYSFDHIPPVLKFPSRVIAIGDIHGDLALLKKILFKTKVINEKEEWIAKNTYVVQVGDQIDDSRNINFDSGIENIDTDVLDYSTKLHIAALNHGSMFISLLGNHEILNVLAYDPKNAKKAEKYLVYVSKKSIDKHKGFQNRAKLFYPGNVYAKLLACTRLPIVVIGKYLFLHGGLTKNTLDNLGIKSKKDFSKIQYLIRRYLLNITKNKKEKEVVEKILMGDIFWTRILYTIPENMSLENELCEKYISDVVNMLELNSIILGHTSNKLLINCKGKLIHLNSMNSRAFEEFKKTYTIEDPTVIEIIKGENNKEDILNIVKI